MPKEGPVDCMQGKTIMMVPLVDILCPGHGKGVYMCVHICVCACIQGFSCLSRGAIPPCPHFGQFAKQCQIITSFVSVTAQ